MKNLIIYSHPNEKSFNHAVLERVAEILRTKKEEYKIIDLYKEKFNPILGAEDFVKMKNGDYSEDVKKYQKDIKEAERLIFIYPTWWWSYPAIFKGFIDRVFSYGFAYRYNERGEVEGLLKGKSAIIFTTTGGTYEVYENYKINDVVMRQIKEGVLSFCGINDIKMKVFYQVPTVDNNKRAEYLKCIEDLI